MIKRLLLLLCLIVTAGSAAWAEIAHGDCKRGSWVIDDSGKLTVNINGDMADYSEGKAPWYGYADQIKAIHISSGCTNIGRNGFYGLTEVESVTGGENVEACAMYSFQDCGYNGNGIPSIYFPKCDYVGECAFSGCGAWAISLPLVETWKACAVVGYFDTYGTFTSNNYAYGYQYRSISSSCNYVDLGSKTKKLRPGSLIGPNYVFCQSPTPPEWERLYDRNEVDYALYWVGQILSLGHLGSYERDYEYPFGDNPDVKVIVPQEYLQTYIDYYPTKHPEVSEGYMCAYYTGDHGKSQSNYPTKSTGKLVAGAPIYENGQFIGGWYVEGSGAFKQLWVFFSNGMPNYEGRTAPWASAGNVERMHLYVSDGKIPAGAFKNGNGLNDALYLYLDSYDPLNIGESAFAGNTHLRFVKHGTDDGTSQQVTVGNSAFKGCTKMMSFEMGIISLGSSAFEGCSELSNVGASGLKLYIQDIPERAFYGVKMIDRMDFSKIRTIGKQAFGGGSGLDEVNLSNCTSVGQEAFADATLGKINFGPSTFACTFGSKCFAGCTRLYDVFVSSILDCNMSSDIFDGVTLSDVTLHCKPELYGQCYEDDDIFGKMEVDRDFTFPVEGSIVGGSASSTWSLSSAGTLRINCWSMPNYNTNREQPWYQYREYIKDIVLDNCQIIGKNAFSEMPYLRNVSIPRDCKEIRDEAFKNCPELENIYITRVETLGSYVFEGCTKLKTIELGMHLATVGDYVFKDCHSLADIENLNRTPAATTKYSFAGIKSPVYDLRGGPRKANDEGQSTVNLNVPDAYVVNYMTDPNWSQFHIAYADNRGTWMKAGKFGDGMWVLYTDSTMVISSERNLTVEESTQLNTHDFGRPMGYMPTDPRPLTKRIEFIGNLSEVPRSFEQFPNLESVKLCPSIKKINEMAFYNCLKLKSVNLQSVDNIGRYAFQDAAFDIIDLTNVKDIQDGAFRGCKNLTIAKLGPVCKLGSYIFSECSKLTAVDLSSADLEEAQGCFSGCASLTFAAVNSTNLCRRLFAGCAGLKAINLGSKVESIEYDAFENCNSLDTVYVDRPTPPVLPTGERPIIVADTQVGTEKVWAFDGLTLKDIHLVVPPDYIPAYKKANIWKDMTIEGDVEVVEPAFPMGGSLYGCGKDMDGQPVEGGTWSLDAEGNFVISGVGGIAAFDKDGKPWCETFNALASLIRNITVTDGVTSIPHDFFGGEHFADISANAETITLGEGLTKVGRNSLSFSGIKDVYIYSGETLGLWEGVFNQDAAVANDATLHVLRDAGFNRYVSYYKGDNATKRFPHIVGDLTQADPKVEDVRFPIAELTMYVDQTINLYELNPEFIPANVKNKTLRFNNLLTSGNVYIDDEGKMTALWEGKAYIEAWTSHTADGTELQAQWGPDGSSTYLKVTITEAPKPEHFFFDYIAGESTDAARITCHVLKNEYIDVDTQIRTCEVAGYFNEDDVTTQAIPEWMTGNVNIPEEPEGFEVVRIGAYSFYERNITALYIPWTVTQIGYNACAYCDYLTDVYIPSYQPLRLTDAYGEEDENLYNNDAFYRIGEGDDGEGYATLHVPEGCVPAWNVYPWNEWFRIITDDAPIPDDIRSIQNSIVSKESWYDLSGRKLGNRPTQPGLYIQNGKKYLVK